MSYFRLIYPLGFCLVLVACAATQIDKPAQPLQGVTADDIKPAGSEDLDAEFRYRLNYGDELDVNFFRQNAYSTTVVVGYDGRVNLPYLPSVRVEGMTIDEASSEISRRYRELIESSPAPDLKIYILGPQDVLQVRFPYLEQYTTTVTIGPDGRISLPLLGAVVAEGKSLGILQSELQAAYGKHIDDPVIALNVVQAASSTVWSNGRRVRVALPEMDNLNLSLRNGLDPKVYVGGEVNAPQALQFQPMMTSLQAIMSAGGVNRRAQLASVLILRKGLDGGPRYIVRDLLADIDGDEAAEGSGEAVTNDILLHPFDIVIVPKTTIAGVSDTLNAYLYDILPILKNSSVGFNYQIGTMRINQDTKVKTSDPNPAVD